MKILKQYENRQFSLQIARTEVQTEEIVNSRPMTEADLSTFKVNEYLDIDLSSKPQTNNNVTNNNVTKNNTITKTVNVDLNDNFKPKFNQNEKLFASKQHNTNGMPNVNESKRVVSDNSIPGLSFNVTVKRS